MARFNKMQVLEAIGKTGMVPVFYHADADVAEQVVKACYEGGVRAFEFTNRGDFAAHVFHDLARHFAQADRSVVLGVGSIVDAPTAALYIASGARFVVGPLLNAEVGRLCNRRGVPYSPGCGSATEIGDAQELGCEIVKVFPGSSVGGPEFVKAMLGPCPWTKIMPTGGVEPTEESLRKWFGAGIVACGIGSNMITKPLLEARDYKGIENNVRAVVELVKNVRAELAAK